MYQAGLFLRQFRSQSLICFILITECLCRLELAYFAGNISKNRLVCKNTVALACYGSWRLLVMGSWFVIFCGFRGGNKIILRKSIIAGSLSHPAARPLDFAFAATPLTLVVQREPARRLQAVCTVWICCCVLHTLKRWDVSLHGSICCLRSFSAQLLKGWTLMLINRYNTYRWQTNLRYSVELTSNVIIQVVCYQ